MRTAALTLCLMGCSTSTHELRVAVRMELAPAYEAVGVVARLDSGQEAQHIFEPHDEVFDPPLPVGQFEVEDGAYTLTVELRGIGGVLVERRARVAVDGENVAITVLFTRDCADVDCPGAGDSPEAIACLGGACVPPECLDTTEPGCDQARECMAATDCPTPSDCAEASCLGGVCIANLEASRCGGGEFCSAANGCVAIESQDAGFDAGVVDAAADVGIDSGPMSGPRQVHNPQTVASDNIETSAMLPGYTVGSESLRMLFVLVTWYDDNEPSRLGDVAFNGMSLTEAAATGLDVDSPDWYYASLYFLMSPPSTTSDIDVEWDTTVDSHSIHAFYVSGLPPSGPIEMATTVSDSNDPLEVALEAQDDTFVVAGIFVEPISSTNSGLTPLGSLTETTEIVEEERFDSRAAMGYLNVPTGGTLMLGWSMDDDNRAYAAPLVAAVFSGTL